MQRRRFIFNLTTAAAAATATATTVTSIAGAFTACQNHHHAAISRQAQPDFLLQVSDSATIRAIGEAYRKQTPGESNENQITALLGKNTDPRSIRQEYAAGKTVTIKGWVLSVTEARQCALYSLESQ